MAGLTQWLHRRVPARRRLSIVACALSAGLLVLSFAVGAKAAQSAPPAYRIIDLGTLDGRESYAAAINNLGQVAGQASVAGGYHAFLYDSTGMHDLGDLGWPASGAAAINDAGQVAGDSNTTHNVAHHAFLYDSTGMHDLGTLGGGEPGVAGLNSAGQIAGTDSIGGSVGTLTRYRPYLYSNGVWHDLGIPPDLVIPPGGDTFVGASGINASGQVLIGVRHYEPDWSRTSIWQSGVWQPLSALDGAANVVALRNLNDAGQVIGELAMPGNNIWHAFVYDSAGVHDLGTFGGLSSFAAGINNLGQVVGYAAVDGPPPTHPEMYNSGQADHPFLYSGGVMYDLTNLLLTTAAWQRFTPSGINDRGQIVGTGWGTPGSSTWQPRAYLLTPDPTAQITVPQASSGLAVKTVSTGELDLTWTDNSDNEQSFEIQRRRSWSDWVTLGSVPPNTTTYSDTSVDPYTHYIYRVRAVDGAGASDWSGEAGGDSGIGAVAALGWTAQDFGSVPLGTSGSPLSLTITNRGTGPLVLQAPTLAGSEAGDFSIVDSPTTLAPGDTGAIHLLFTPSALGSRSAQLILESNATNAVEPIGLTGTGTPPPAPTVRIIPRSLLDFRQQPVGLSGSLAVVLQNNGDAPLTVSGIAIQGLDAAEFGLAPGGWSGGTLHPGDIALLNVTFSPAMTGGRSAALVITDDAADSPQSITLTGFGTAPLMRLSADSLIFGLQAGSTQTLTLTNTGDAPLNISGLDVSGPDAGHFQIISDTGEKSLPVGGSRTIQIAFQTATVAGAPHHARIAGVGYSATLEIHDNDPHPGTPHTVSLIATTGAGPAGDSAPPAAPTSLTAHAPSAGEVDLAWTDHSDNEQAFAIWRSGGGQDWSRAGITGPHATSYADTTVQPGVSYTYKVRAVNGGGASDWSNVVSLTPWAPPAAPTGLAADAAGKGVTLTWGDNSSGEQAFAIWRSGGGADWARVGIAGPGATTYTDTAIQPGTAYAYQVRAINRFGASGWSNTVSVITGAAPPAAPAGLAATVSGGQVTLTWTNVSIDAHALAIWRQGGGQEWARVGIAGPQATSYTDSGLTPGTSYTYRVRAIGAGGASGWSNAVSVLVPAAP